VIAWIPRRENGRERFTTPSSDSLPLFEEENVCCARVSIPPRKSVHFKEGSSWLLAGIGELPVALWVIGALAAVFSASLSASSLPAYLEEGSVIRPVGDRFCGPYVVWHSLRLFRKEASLDSLITEMNVPAGGVPLQSVENTLSRHGVSNQVRRFSSEMFLRLTQPVILHATSTRAEEPGHVVLAVNDGHGRFVVVDGTEVEGPYDVSLLESAVQEGRISDLVIATGKDVLYRPLGWKATGVILLGEGIIVLLAFYKRHWEALCRVNEN